MDREGFLARFRPSPAPSEPPAVPAWTGGADPDAFLARLEAGGGRARRGARGDWPDQVVAQAGEWDVRRAVVTGEPALAPAIDALRACQIEVTTVGVEAPPAGLRERAAAADLGLTTARWGLTSTGTSVLVADAQSPRLVSLLPSAHLAVLWEEDLLPDLAALARATRQLGAMPSAVTLVTGPSRTADIEQTLVVGVHGPARMGVVLVSSGVGASPAS
ncbi:MAG: lactate utilization protein [Actinomycetota bacterium]|nr:lactate utilization protein [Actinomycetota bacterium]